MFLTGHPSPPVFRQQASRWAHLIILVLVCIVLLIADLRYRYLEVVRQAVSVVTHPLQLAASAPVDFLRNASVYFATLAEVQIENAKLRRQQLMVGQSLLRFQQLKQENEQLRKLLEMSKSFGVRSVAAEIIYDAPDIFARKVIIDRGSRDGLEGGMAVVDVSGLIGQVTRVYPIQSEVTLLSDREQEVPVAVQRNGLRGVVVGNGQAPISLRFMLLDADLQVGDMLVTSGLDGLFLPGIPVARVTQIHKPSQGEIFLEVRCEAVAYVERAIQVLVLGKATGPSSDSPLPEVSDDEEAL